ncbi:CheY-like chemotaxis protein [Rhodopseudomonas rhenobacensis]|uniref:CheY-like chemotaxis protein n=1 Tax=Rhodopseudomonas rhenobacensis TaxID=87461 RepID=A0A7W7Z8B9_9BRAD|nr:response regulator [Rhodopseudomonas rhenobacensis]MBB5049769.1 CheY-like chemotaxis protein [Rhodopseudomonas rhenobacensis]
MTGGQGRTPPSSVVLIVEDDALLRMLAADVVEDAGHVAVQARDADEALAILRTRRDIAMVFTDINMPGSMNGLELAYAVRAGWPPIKIVVASGRIRLSPAEMPPECDFLGKPYLMSDLTAQLQSLAGRNPICA